MASKVSQHFKRLLKNLKRSGFHLVLLTILVTLIWMVGYFNFSLLWIYMFLTFYGMYIYNNELRRLSFERGIKLSIDEEKFLNSFLDLPTWVNFPEVERAEWLNKIIHRLWPSIGKYLEEFVQENILPKIHGVISDFELKSVSFGNTAPKIGGVRIYDSQVGRDEIYIDINVYYYSDCTFTGTMKNIPLGIKDFEMRMDVRVHATPLLPVIPFIGAFSVSLVKNPFIQFDFTEAASLLNAPYLKGWLREAILDAIAAMIVLPNRMPFQLIKTANIDHLLFPMPEGVVRMNIIEAKSLRAADIELFGRKNKSDPYVTIRVGAEKFKTKVIDNTLDPKWDETFEAVVESTTYQAIELEIFDKDRNSDDFLGKINIGSKLVYEKGFSDMWMQLEETKSGLIHLALTWLTLSPDPLAFERIEMSETMDQPISTGFFYVFLDSAKNLKSTKGNSEPNPFVEVTVGNQTKSTSIQKKTSNPVWQNSFNFLLQSAYTPTLYMEVKDEKTNKCLGSYSFKIQQLMSDANMSRSETVKLKDTDQDSTLQINVALRALVRSTRKSSNFHSAIESPLQSSNFHQLNSENEVRLRRPESLQIEDLPGTGGDDKDGVDAVFKDNSPEIDSPKSDIHSLLQSDINSNTNGTNEMSVESFRISNYSNRFNKSQLSVSMWYETNKKTLYVVINEIIDMPDDYSNVYIKVYMHPKDVHHKTRKTDVVKRTSDNQFLYKSQFEFSIELASLHISILQFDLKNVDKHKSLLRGLKRNPIIGRCKIDLSDKIPSDSSKSWHPIEIRRKHREEFGKQSIKSDISM